MHKEEPTSATPDFSEAFYTRNAQRYAEVSHHLLQSVYIDACHPGLKDDMDLMDRHSLGDYPTGICQASSTWRCPAVDVQGGNRSRNGL